MEVGEKGFRAAGYGKQHGGLAWKGEQEESLMLSPLEREVNEWRGSLEKGLECGQMQKLFPAGVMFLSHLGVMLWSVPLT